MLEAQFDPEHEMVQSLKAQLRELDRQRPTSVRLLHIQRKSDQLQRKLQTKCKDIEDCKEQVESLKAKEKGLQAEVDQIKAEMEDMQKARRELVIPKKEGATPLLEALGVPSTLLEREEFTHAKQLLGQLEPLVQRMLEAATQAAGQAEADLKEEDKGSPKQAGDVGRQDPPEPEGGDVDMEAQDAEEAAKEMERLLRQCEASLLAGGGASEDPAAGNDDGPAEQERAALRRQLCKDMTAASVAKRQKKCG